MKTVRHSFDTIISNEAEDFNLPVGRGSGSSAMLKLDRGGIRI